METSTDQIPPTDEHSDEKINSAEVNPPEENDDEQGDSSTENDVFTREMNQHGCMRTFSNMLSSKRRIKVLEFPTDC